MCISFGWCLLYISCLVAYCSIQHWHYVDFVCRLLSFSETTSSAATCHILLKSVVIKDSYQKIASNKVTMRFCFRVLLCQR